MTIHVPKAIALYLAWIAFIGGTLAVAIGDLLPFHLGFIRPESAFTCLIEAELFFVLVIWPFFIPHVLVRRATPGPRLSGESHLLVFQIGILFVVALPIAILSQNLADVGVAEFFRGHLLVAVMGCFVAALFSAVRERRANPAPAYFLALFALSALAPFAHFLSMEYAGASLAWMSVLSPFWGAASLDGDLPMVTVGLFGAATLALILLPGTARPAATAA